MSNEYDEQRMIICDRRSATTKVENGLNDSWTNSFNDSLHLRPGDRVAVYNSFIAEKGAGTAESIEFKQIDLKSKTPHIQQITQTQIIPAGSLLNNAGLNSQDESGLRFYKDQNVQNAAAGGGTLGKNQSPIVYMDYCENVDEGVLMRDNQTQIAINYYKCMDGLSYFQLPRRWAFDNYRDINRAFNTAPQQWADHDDIDHGRSRQEPVEIADSDALPIGTTTIYRPIDKVVGYVLDDYKLVLDDRTDIVYDPLTPLIRGQTRQGRVAKVILKNDNSRYTILKRKKNLMYPQNLVNALVPPISVELYADFVPPYYAADPEYHDYLLYTEKVDLQLQPGFTSSKYVSEELTRQMRSLNEDENRNLERHPTGQYITDPQTLTTIEQFVETATYKRFACSNDHYGAQKYFEQTLDNSEFVAPGNPQGVSGPTILSPSPNIGFVHQDRVITFLQQYQYIGCKRPELYLAGTEANDIFGFEVNSFSPVGQVLDRTFFQNNPLQIALEYNEANLLKLKKLMDAQGNYPELFSKENIANLYKNTIDQIVPSVDTSNVYYYVRGGPSAETLETSFVNIDNARFLHMNPQNTSYYNNLIHGDLKLDANWRDYAQLGCGYYDFRGNLITNVDTGATNQNEFSRQLNNTLQSGQTSELRYNSKPFFFHYEPSTKDTFFEAETVVNENSATTNYSYGCFGRDSVRGQILVYPNKIIATSDGGNTSGVGLPYDFFTDRDGLGNNILSRGRKVGFDRHFNAWGNACVCLTSGIPRLEYQQVLDGTKDFWGTSTQRGISPALVNSATNNPVEGIYSAPAVENDLQPFLNQIYLGADAPAIQFDGAHFNFQNLHTPLNKGNLNTLAIGDASGDEEQVVYKVNPQQAFNNLTPTQLPYENTIKFSYTNGGTADEERRRLNRNLEPFSIYDTTTGIFIQDFGYNEDVWDDSLWGRIGFTYEQFHNTNLNERQKRYTDFTDTSNILTTNANVKSSDIKSWAQNKFKEAQYTGVAFHPFQFTGFAAVSATAPPVAAADSILEFLPELIVPTSSVSIVAKEYPTQISNGFYNIRSDLALNVAAIMGGGDTSYPIVGIADKTTAVKDFFISSPSSISHTITRPVTISSITTNITDPDGTASRCSPNSVVIYRITRTMNTNYDILGDLERKLQELENEKNKKK